MISVEEAEKIIQSQTKDFGTERIPLELTLGRVLAEDIEADRDLPPYNRVTMDGIAISYEAFKKGIHSFHIKAVQAAGDDPVEIDKPDECIEIMTGAALSATTDTIIRYEDLNIINGMATVLTEAITIGQNIHIKGKDKKKNEVVAAANQLISAALINIAAAIGSTHILVKKFPTVVIISSGDELIQVYETPSPYQIRNSNNYAIQAVLHQYSLRADMLHIPDDPQIIKQKIQHCLQNYDAIIMSGGISMGKFDYIPKALEELSVNKFFHKVKQRPGKPFWLGKHSDGAIVFALPGNPVSTFMCLHRYFLPWLESSCGIGIKPTLYAVLEDDFTFNIPLQYFLQVRLHVNIKGQILATPVEGNGSGDFANLLVTDAFMELPMEQNIFRKGEVYRIWPFKQIFMQAGVGDNINYQAL